MTDITPELASGAVNAALNSLYNKKTETQQKQLAKAVESGDSDKAAELQAELSEIKEKYSVATWIPDAANRMAKQLSFGTHISKGIHSSSKGDNINFSKTNSLPKGVIGHQSLLNPNIDASGNAAALPLYSFLNFNVHENKKIMDYIIENDVHFKNSLADNREESERYFQIFRKLLIDEPTKPCTSEYNKQILWAIDQGSDSYICIIPLYPSSLTNQIHAKVQKIKYSDEVKEAKKNRFLVNSKKTPYATLSDIATVTIGGSNPQGVSKHMSSQRGKNYLLPSLPPIITQERTFKLSKFADSIFGAALEYNARDAIHYIFKTIKDTRNIVDVREARKRAIDEVLYQIFAIAEDIRTTMPAGWSVHYELNRAQKLWLDPKRADLEGEEAFKTEREQDDAWHQTIVHSFARWLNTLMQTEFKAIAHDFGDAEHLEWEREIEAMKKHYERAGRGVFL